MRALPSNADAEMAVLGAIVTNERAAALVLPLLRPEHFWAKDRARTYELIVARRAAGLPSTPSPWLRPSPPTPSPWLRPSPPTSC
jgi:replicative DNA helicase